MKKGIPHWISYTLQHYCSWPVFLQCRMFWCLWFVLQRFEKEMLLIIFQELCVVGFHIWDTFWVKYLFWKQQQHVSNFPIFTVFSGVSYIRKSRPLEPLYLTSTQTVQQWESKICSCICIRYGISVTFMALSLTISRAHEKLRKNHQNVGWKEPEPQADTQTRTYTSSSSSLPIVCK